MTNSSRVNWVFVQGGCFKEECGLARVTAFENVPNWPSASVIQVFSFSNLHGQDRTVCYLIITVLSAIEYSDKRPHWNVNYSLDIDRTTTWLWLAAISPSQVTAKWTENIAAGVVTTILRWCHEHGPPSSFCQLSSYLGVLGVPKKRKLKCNTQLCTTVRTNHTCIQIGWSDLRLESVCRIAVVVISANRAKIELESCTTSPNTGYVRTSTVQPQLSGNLHNFERFGRILAVKTKPSN